MALTDEQQAKIGRIARDIAQEGRVSWGAELCEAAQLHRPIRVSGTSMKQCQTCKVYVKRNGDLAHPDSVEGV